MTRSEALAKIRCVDVGFGAYEKSAEEVLLDTLVALGLITIETEIPKTPLHMFFEKWISEHGAIELDNVRDFLNELDKRPWNTR